MEWLLIVLVFAAGVAVYRVYTNVRRQRAGAVNESWDAKAINHLRKQGMDPFRAYDVVFFFALPDEAACQAVRGRLEGEGYQVNAGPMANPGEYAFSLQAVRNMRLSVPEMTELSRRFGALAHENRGRYDGWTPQSDSR